MTTTFKHRIPVTLTFPEKPEAITFDLELESPRRLEEEEVETALRNVAGRMRSENWGYCVHNCLYLIKEELPETKISEVITHPRKTVSPRSDA